ncbi:MAG: hypothetical protein AAGJ93_13795 [Bacteroidota bacterium]
MKTKDLKHQKLISGLAQVGLEDSNLYDLDILTIIQQMMPINSEELSDTFTDVYYSFIREISNVETAQMDEQIPDIAYRCYEMLISLEKVGEGMAVR